jgi:tubulysin polyketide synthase-like protein
VSGAVAALALAQEAGVRLRVDEDKLKVIGRPETVPAEALATLRQHKAEVLELLTGHRCRYCGRRVTWNEPSGVPFADGTAAHVSCYDQAEIARLLKAGRRVAKDAVAVSNDGEILTREDEP